MNYSLTCLITTAILAITLAQPALAKSRLSAESLNHHIEHCYNETKQGAAGQIRLCNKVIRSRQATPHNQAVALHNRGVIQLHRGNADLALNDFISAAQREPSLLPTLLVIGELYHQSQKPQEAAKYFDMAFALDADHPTLTRYRHKGWTPSAVTRYTNRHASPKVAAPILDKNL